jgi:hypothetical protein
VNGIERIKNLTSPLLTGPWAGSMGADLAHEQEPVGSSGTAEDETDD